MFPAFNLFGPLHALGFLAFSVGIVLLLVWAIKTLHAAQLKNWGLALAIGGLVACGISVLGTASYHGFGKNMMQNRVKMMREMKEYKPGMMDDAETMHRMMMGDDEDGMGMSMDDMTATLEGKAGDDFDKAFLELMVPHHQGAIDMAKLAEDSAKHDEIKAMAKDILSAQQREIDQMNQWMKDWGYAK